MIPDVSHIVGQFDQNKMLKAASQFQAAQLRPHAFRLLRAFGTCCYSISPAGAHALKELCLPLRNVSVTLPGSNRSLQSKGIDRAMNAAYPKD
jgi:hypothetical protein